ncbi:uncharacterized protein BXZ73DRAFT_82628 [Epithele typhae]|uniref:uncharacterized protein n=1 Tax=Epithele typhae TaxID=378194 RepID=UPI0020083334|nr:uncharacterized protein BXZ73DRAFT_82628 [Epithele typhae]KAH9911774.1 hypothetical protein BXZ73DRAFT_82628 [Epithele typhae]
MEENLEEQIALAWSPPVYDTGRVPHQLLSAQFPENTSGEPDAHNHTIFARCPDGSAALAQCEDRTFRFLQLPPELLGITADASKHAALPASIMQPSPILDFAWYPSATIHDPASFCFVASLRASYRIVDHRERQIAPHSLAFNVAASRLYCGFEDAIEVFDVHRPGEGTRLHITPSKKSRDGLKGAPARSQAEASLLTRASAPGIVSALAFAPDVSSDLYAAGTLNPSAPTSSNIALFQEAAGEAPVMLVGAEDTHPAPGTGYGVRASVSQLAFNPARPYLLYASFRRTDTIYAWDLRGDVTRPVALYDKSAAPKGSAPAAKTKAKTQTNQRLRFDIDLGGTRLAVGDERGCISVFDLTEPETAADAGARTPALQFHAHGDAVGSVAFHPLHPLALSVAGSRHFGGAAAAVREGDSDSSEDSDEDSDEDDGPDGDRMGRGKGSQVRAPSARRLGRWGRSVPPRGGRGGVGARIVRLPRRRRGPVALDASVKLWRFAHD